MEGLREELYRSLKAENAAYNDKIQTLWLTKLTLCGALTAFLLINQGTLDSFVEGGRLAGVALVPILAIALDVKVAEYSLHVRAISRFIARTHAGSEVQEWEAVLWGDIASPERRLVRLRTMLTVLAAAIPTVAMIALAWLIFSHAGFGWPALLASGALVLLYAASVAAAALTVLRSPTQTRPS